MDEDKVKLLIDQRLAALFGMDRYTFQKHLQIFDGRNIQTGRTNGTKIGTAADQKLGFFGATPVTRQGAITAPTGGATTDAESRTAIASLISALQALGLIS